MTQFSLTRNPHHASLFAPNIVCSFSFRHLLYLRPSGSLQHQLMRAHFLLRPTLRRFRSLSRKWKSLISSMISPSLIDTLKHLFSPKEKSKISLILFQSDLLNSEKQRKHSHIYGHRQRQRYKIGFWGQDLSVSSQI